MDDVIKVIENRGLKYLIKCMEDPKLNVWHLAILTAIVSLGYKQGKRRRIKVSRRTIMALSHINTLPTYHKYFKELQNLGYIKYTSSYHPKCRSEVELIRKRLS